MTRIFTLLLLLVGIGGSAQAQSFANFRKIAADETLQYGQLAFFHDPAANKFVIQFSYDEVEAPFLPGSQDQRAPFFEIVDLAGQVLWQDQLAGGDCTDPFGNIYEENYFGPLAYKCGEACVDASGIPSGVYLIRMRLAFYEVYRKVYLNAP